MKDAINKTFYWLMMFWLVILGMAAIHYSEQWGTVKLIFPALMCFGFSFVLGSLWPDFRDKYLLTTIIVMLVTAYAAQYVEPGIYFVFGEVMEVNYFIGWTLLMTAVAFPVMTYIFYRYD